ncbi:replication initiation protein RepC [Methylobacterium sp. P31]
MDNAGALPARWGGSASTAQEPLLASDLVDTANLARSALGISPDAWRDAQETMRSDAAALTVAAILQTAEHIKSPGGYLRSLVERKRAGEFSLGPILQALTRGSP